MDAMKCNKDGWVKKKLGEVCEIIMGQSPSSESYNSDGKGLPFFQGCSDFGLLYPNEKVYCTSPNKVAQAKDVLISVRAPVGTLNIANKECCIGRGLAAIRCDSSTMNYKFVYYFLVATKSVLEMLGTGAVFKAINKKQINEHIIEVPSCETQATIVSELDCLNGIIEKQKEQLKQLDELAQSIFYDMFGDPMENEKGWEIHILDKLCRKVTDGTHDTPERLTEGKRFITGKHIRPGIVDYENSDYVDPLVHIEIYKRCNPERGDVLYTNIGANLATAAINTVNYEFSMKNVALLKLENSILNGYYLEYFLNNDDIKENIIDNHSNGGAQKFLSLKSIRTITILVPPLDLQQAFAQKIEAIEHQKELIKKSIAETETLFNSRMDYYFG